MKKTITYLSIGVIMGLTPLGLIKTTATAYILAVLIARDPDKNTKIKITSTQLSKLYPQLLLGHIIGHATLTVITTTPPTPLIGIHLQNLPTTLPQEALAILAMYTIFYIPTHLIITHVKQKPTPDQQQEKAKTQIHQYIRNNK